MLASLTRPRAAVRLAVVGASIYSLLQWWLKRNRYGGLQGIVSFSARLIAASRALESQEEDCAIIRDPLAIYFAGNAAMSVIRTRMLGDAVLYDKDAARKEHGVVLRRTYKVSRIGLRTRWFDQGVLNALTPGQHPLPVAVSCTVNSNDTVSVSLSLRPPVSQVVLLAAGMDARAWRLPLPPGTPVFELDKPDVVAAKATILQQLRVQTAPQQPGCAHALRAGSWTSLAADLTDPSWGELLQAGGFDRTRPCVWVLEGLLMYLDDAQAAALIEQCAALSAPGSVLLAGWNSAVTLSRAQNSSSELARQWKSGYPADIGPYFQRLGWRTSHAASAAQLAACFEAQMPGLQFYLKQGGAGGSGRDSSTSTPYIMAAL